MTHRGKRSMITGKTPLQQDQIRAVERKHIFANTVYRFYFKNAEVPMCNWQVIVTFTG